MNAATDPKLLAARRDADTARADVFAILGELQRRVMPSTILHEGMEAVRDKATEAAAGARRLAREQPGAVAGAAGVAVAALAWVPLRRFFRRHDARRIVD